VVGCRSSKQPKTLERCQITLKIGDPKEKKRKDVQNGKKKIFEAAGISISFSSYFQIQSSQTLAWHGIGPCHQRSSAVGFYAAFDQAVVLGSGLRRHRALLS